MQRRNQASDRWWSQAFHTPLLSHHRSSTALPA